MILHPEPALAAAGPLAALAQPFFARAVLAGTGIAAACGIVGYFVVLRAQVFTGDALSHVAFTGALGALVAGLDLRVGLFVACAGFGLVMGLLGERGRADDVVIGSTFAWVLGIGVLLLALYARASGGGATSGVRVLFGSIFGLSASDARLAAAVGAAVVVAVGAIARPLLFASLDEAVAAAAGVRVGALGVAFLVLVGITAGEATQAVGALLLLGLLAAPASAALRLVDRPWPAAALSVGLSVGSMWAGLGLAYAVPVLPPSFTVVAVATLVWVGALAATGPLRARRGARRRPPRAPAPGGSLTPPR